jgi:hypothetical protein
MDIEKYIDKKCPCRNEDSDSGIHDRAFARALAGQYEIHKNKSLEQLKLAQMLAREDYRFGGNTHRATAACMIIYELIEEKS